MSYIASTYLTNYQLSYTTQHSSWLRIDFGGQRMIDLGGDTGCLHSMYLLDSSQCIEPIFFLSRLRLKGVGCETDTNDSGSSVSSP